MDKSPNPVKLIVQRGPNAGRVFAVTELNQTIGRGSGCDIHIPDQTLSRQHARIRTTASGCVVEDLGSTNGTFVNGQKITGPTLVRPGDALQLGELVTFSLQADRPNLDDLETIAPGLPQHGLGPKPSPAPAPPATATAKSNQTVWLLVGAGVLLVALLLIGGLIFLYAATSTPPTAVAQPPTPTPQPVQVAVEVVTPTAAPPASPTPEIAPSSTPTPLPLAVPGLPAGSAQEQLPPPDVTSRLSPFCNDIIEVKANEPLLVSWSQRLAAPADQIDYRAQWLASAFYDITLDGRPITERGGLNYYQTAGPTLNWWINIGLLEPGAHYLRVQWYTSREISNGLDIQPADGQMDFFGPGAAGEGHCEIIVAAPTVVVEDTPTTAPSATPQPTPTPAQVQQSLQPAPLGVFQDFEQPDTWQRGDEPNGELSRAATQVHSGNYAGRLSYNFPSARNDYVVFLRNHPLAGDPNAISVWVYGDNSGHYLNLWLKDARGQTWQMSFGQINHSGWRELTAILDPGQPWPAGHVSGPANGVIDYPITFQALVLDDAPDSYSGSGNIYLDDLFSREMVAFPTPTPATGAPQVGATPIPTGPYRLAVGKHIYEPWGAPIGGDVCEAYRRHAFDDKVHMKGFNLELLLTNNSTVPVADDWAPDFITAKGRTAQVCYYGYAGSGPQPGRTNSMTFFTIVEPDDYVRTVQLNVNGQFIQICLDSSGAPGPC